MQRNTELVGGRSTGSISDEHVEHLTERAMFVRLETIRLLHRKGGPLTPRSSSCAEIFAARYYDTMRLRRREPAWPGRRESRAVDDRRP